MKKRMVFFAVIAMGMVLSSFFPGPALGQNPKAADGKKPGEEIVVSGKLFCSLKRQVIAPFPGVVTSLEVKVGMMVAEGDVLARFKLEPQAALNIRKRASQFGLKELEMKLAQVENSLAQLQGKQVELKQLARDNLAPAQSLVQIERDVQLQTEQRELLKASLRLERSLADEDLKLLKTLLGGNLKPGQVPDEVALRAPIGGHVVWIHQDVRIGAEIVPQQIAVQIGVMEPMLFRAQVHEIEAAKLKIGDKAKFSLESAPGRVFDATVNRLSWAPVSPLLEPPSYYEIEFIAPNPEFVLKEGFKGRLFFE
ncbi:MAG: efflux RND transporter periplasmic adaptor subunit [Pseudomonadota bacterium]